MIPSVSVIIETWENTKYKSSQTQTPTCAAYRSSSQLTSRRTAKTVHSSASRTLRPSSSNTAIQTGTPHTTSPALGSTSCPSKTRTPRKSGRITFCVQGKPCRSHLKENVSRASATQVRARTVLLAKTHPITTSSVIAYPVSLAKRARQKLICVSLIRVNTVVNASTWSTTSAVNAPKVLLARSAKLT